MRHSTAHLVVAFCSSMAVSAAPLSPLPPRSPALISPSLTSRSTEPEDLESKDLEPTVKKRSVGGFAYHTADGSAISKRDDSVNKGVVKTQANRNFVSDSDSDSDTSSSSDSDFDKRSIPALAIRSPHSSPQEQGRDKNNEQADESSLQDISSIQAEESGDGWESDENAADFESNSIASDDENFVDETSANNDKVETNTKTKRNVEFIA